METGKRGEGGNQLRLLNGWRRLSSRIKEAF
jgi:hypothetical protein